MPQRGVDFAVKIGNSTALSSLKNKLSDQCAEAHRYSNIASLDE